MFLFILYIKENDESDVENMEDMVFEDQLGSSTVITMVKWQHVWLFVKIPRIYEQMVLQKKS